MAMLLSIAFFGCRPYTARDSVDAPLETPSAFARGPEAAPGATPEETPEATPDRWWEAFGDSTISALVERALSGNFGIRRAFARIAQAAALEAQAAAGHWPHVSGGFDVSRSRSRMFIGGPLGRVDRTTNQFNLGLQASYELDLWGRVGSLRDAAELEVRAGRLDLEAAAMTLTAEVVETYLRLVEQRAQERLLLQQVEVGERFLELTEIRFGQGLAAAVDVYQQRRLIAANLAEEPLVRSRAEVLENQLAALLGTAPGQEDFLTESNLPPLPPLPPLGVPADLLHQRPDLSAIVLRIQAADHRVAAAVASRFPTVRLTASTGFLARDIVKLFEGFIYSLAGGITGILIDGGQMKAEVERTKAVVDELLALYGETLIMALGEVEDALVQERRQTEHLAAAKRQLAISRATLRESRLRYSDGLTDFLPVLTALQTVQQLERNVLTARRQALSHRVQLSRALGGSWTRDLTRPATPDKDEDDMGRDDPATEPPARRGIRLRLKPSDGLDLTGARPKSEEAHEPGEQ